jgi:hypothetical protein
MSKRIRELYAEAVMSVHDAFIDKMLVPSSVDLEFAELIVQECIKRINNYDLVPGHSAKWEDIYDIHARLLQDLGEELKEHFGIEE